MGKVAVKSSVEASKAAFLRTIREADFQLEVFKLARQQRWLVYSWHPLFEPEREHWRTPVSGDKGWPDAVFLRGSRILFRELKSESGKLRPEQKRAIEALKLAGMDVKVWRPRDLEQIKADLAL